MNVHKESQFTSKFRPTSARDIFKQSDLMDRAILQASDRSRKKSQIFGATFAEKQSVKKWPIPWELSGKISLETDRFYADLTSVFSVF